MPCGWTACMFNKIVTQVSLGVTIIKVTLTGYVKYYSNPEDEPVMFIPNDNDCKSHQDSKDMILK